jgi:hypothetical protein
MENVLESVIKLQKMIDNAKNIEEFEYIESYKQLLDKQLDQTKKDLTEEISKKKSELFVNRISESVNPFNQFIDKILKV